MAGLSVRQWTSPRARRIALAVLLAALVLVPYGRSAATSRACRGADCPADGQVRWSAALPGTWLAENGTQGTVYAASQPYAAAGDGTAAVGFGLTVYTLDEATGAPRWTATLAGMPAGSSIVSVRSWPGVLTVGVDLSPAGSSAIQSPVRAGAGRSAAGSSAVSGRSGSAGGGAPWEVTVLNALTGRTLRSYPSAAYGGAVSATLTRTVVVGTTAVTCYDNGSGRVIWRDQIGSAGQAWHVDAGYLYVTVSAGGVIGTAPVTAVRQINLRSGAERLIQPPHGPFAGGLSGVVYGDLLFTSAAGLNVYSAGTGQLVASQPGAVPQGVDPVRHVLYVDAGGILIGIDPATGARVPHTAVPGPPGIYGVRDGVALGLDPGASGAAWGYSIAKRRVVWTTRSLPWPHYFLDPAGIGGSADPANSTVLIATCARVGPLVQAAAPGGRSAYACLRPRLVAISR